MHPDDFLKCLSDGNVPSTQPLVSDIIQVSDNSLNTSFISSAKERRFL